MKKITTLCIINVCVKNCRNYNHPMQIDLFQQTTITGANGIGKTTIAHAITYAFFGVNYYGLQDIGFIRNEKATDIAVQISFVDQDGEYHRLVRVRKGNEAKTSITLDSYTIRQADIEYMLCEKALFLSFFNPLYLPSLPDNAARGLVLKYLPTVTHEQVMAAMSDGFRHHLEGMSLDDPDSQLKSYRAELKRINTIREQLNGERNAYHEQKQTAGERRMELLNIKEELQQKYDALKARQYEGIDLESLETSRTILMSKIKSNHAEIQRLTGQLKELEKRTYSNKYTPALAEIEAKVNEKKQQYGKLRTRYSSVRPGVPCPICRNVIHDSQMKSVSEYYDQQLKEIKEAGQELVAQQKDVEKLAIKDQEIFNQYLKNDWTKLKDELATLQHENDSVPGHPSLADKVDEINRQIQYGNLTEQELIDMSAYEAEMKGIDERIKELEPLVHKDHLTEIINSQTALEDDYTRALNIISALQEYLTVRAKLAVAPLQMPHVTVRLYDQLLSGTVENTFCFEYMGRRFSYLSPSERIRTGIEISIALRKLTGLDFPMFLDEAESVDDLSGSNIGCLETYRGMTMPSQTFICKCAEGLPLTITDRAGKVNQLAKVS